MGEKEPTFCDFAKRKVVSAMREWEREKKRGATCRYSTLPPFLLGLKSKTLRSFCRRTSVEIKVEVWTKLSDARQRELLTLVSWLTVRPQYHLCWSNSDKTCQLHCLYRLMFNPLKTIYLKLQFYLKSINYVYIQNRLLLFFSCIIPALSPFKFLAFNFCQHSTYIRKFEWQIKTRLFGSSYRSQQHWWSKHGATETPGRFFRSLPGLFIESKGGPIIMLPHKATLHWPDKNEQSLPSRRFTFRKSVTELGHFFPTIIN